MTEINQSFMQEIARHQHRLYLLLAVVTGTILLLTGILVFTLRQKRTIKQLQTQHANDNERLRELNERLSVINRQQETINDELSKANTVKDKYIRHYMQLSTLYINKLERFRVQLFKTFNTHGWTASARTALPLLHRTGIQGLLQRVRHRFPLDLPRLHRTGQRAAA